METKDKVNKGRRQLLKSTAAGAALGSVGVGGALSPIAEAISSEMPKR